MNWLISSVAVDFISDFNIRNTKNASYYFISDSDKSTMKTRAQKPYPVYKKIPKT